MCGGKCIASGSVCDIDRQWKGRRVVTLECISYDARLNQIISSSNDPQSAVVIGCIHTSPSAEIQLTESGFTEVKPRPPKSADGKSRKNRLTGESSASASSLLCVDSVA